MTAEIKFGTSGWRAIVAEDFTLGNIRRAVAGIAQYVASQPGPKTVLVGRDPRFLGEMFVAEAANVLAAHAVKPIVIPDPPRRLLSRMRFGSSKRAAPSTSPRPTIRRSTTGSSTPRPTARPRCPK